MSQFSEFKIFHFVIFSTNSLSFVNLIPTKIVEWKKHFSRFIVQLSKKRQVDHGWAQ